MRLSDALVHILQSLASAFYNRKNTGVIDWWTLVGCVVLVGSAGALYPMSRVQIRPNG
jgi:hypothetical protein